LDCNAYISTICKITKKKGGPNIIEQREGEEEEEEDGKTFHHVQKCEF
jgi:hypothetical protein